MEDETTTDGVAGDAGDEKETDADPDLLEDSFDDVDNL